MKFVTVRDLRNHSAKIWRLLNQEKDMIITSNGKPLALLSFLSEENVEDSLKNVRRSRAMVALNSIHKQSLSNGGDKITHTEIDQEMKAVRKRRAK